MTPGSAGGELGDHGALRGEKTIPDLMLQCRYPVCPSRHLPSVSANLGRNLRSAGSAPFTMAQHGSPCFPSHCHTDLEVQRGRDSPEDVIVEAMISLDHGR